MLWCFGTVMLGDTLYRLPREVGFHCLQQRGERGARELTTLRLCLAPGQDADYVCVDEETVLVLLHGSGVAAFGIGEQRIARRSVFDEQATAIYLPPGQALHVSADESLEAILVSTPAASGSSPVIATPSDVTVNPRGRDTYYREVHDIFVRDPHATRLMVGEVRNPPGHWSSFPPHKHDGRHGEPRQEEIYYFRVDPVQGFGQQILYTGEGEAVAHQVGDGDLVLIPYGYHPVSAPPGYRLYYLWAMAGDVRQLVPYEDPAHRWIHDAPAS